LVLISAAAADPDCAGDRSTAPRWNTAGEDHDASVAHPVWRAVAHGRDAMCFSMEKGPHPKTETTY
jgi:hypothetical protein